MSRRHLIIRTESSDDAVEFCKFFRELVGKKWRVYDVGLSALSSRTTKGVRLIIEEAEG